MEQRIIPDSLAAFFESRDSDGVSNNEKIKSNAKTLRRTAETDKGKSFDSVETSAESGYPVGVVVKEGRLIGFGINILNEDVYPIQSFEIFLRNCRLSGSLDLSECHDLIFTDVYFNEIGEVKLGSHPALRILGVQHNRLSSIDVSGLGACQGIDIGFNMLKEIDVSNNSALVELYINDNGISEIDLSHNSELKYFYCHNNRISRLDTTGNPLLRHLNATGNPMKEIRSLAPQRDGRLPLELNAEGNGYVGLKYAPVYNAQWKETGEWEQSYHAVPKGDAKFVGWFDGNGALVSSEEVWMDEYGTSRVLTAKFED